MGTVSIWIVYETVLGRYRGNDYFVVRMLFLNAAERHKSDSAKPKLLKTL